VDVVVLEYTILSRELWSEFYNSFYFQLTYINYLLLSDILP
jgi:hypothetical protein